MLPLAAKLTASESSLSRKNRKQLGGLSIDAGRQSSALDCPRRATIFGASLGQEYDYLSSNDANVVQQAAHPYVG